MLVLRGVNAAATHDGHIFGPAEAKLWFGAIDDLWKIGKPTGQGGPWKESVVKANVPSDPYLITGYDSKTLTITHDAPQSVEVALENDFYADGQWYVHQRFTVEPDKSLTYEFPKGYAAHWLRVRAGADCIGTAQLRCE
jgi:hypothetical protein